MARRRGGAGLNVPRPEVRSEAVRLSSAVLWLHVLCGVSWVGVAASFVLAAAALAGQSRELRDFTVRVAPRLNRLCLASACLIPLSGVVNLGFAAQARGFRLPAEFVGIMGVKLGLFALMAFVLWRAIERTAMVGRVPLAERREDQGAALVDSLVRLYGLMAAMGGVALIMGLWLAGV